MQISELIANNGSTTSSGQGIADDFQTFLTLLTTQLQNQDPTSPMDTDEFTSQLVEFAGVEQQLEMNDHLDSLVNLSLSDYANSAASYLGKEVTVGTSIAALENSSANWAYSIEADAAETTLSIVNQAGETVYTTSGATSEGSHVFDWGGRDNDGTLQEDGYYTLVVEAKDSGGNTITSSASVTGIVSSIELVGFQPLLTVNGLQVTTDAVSTINQPEALSELTDAESEATDASTDELPEEETDESTS